MEDELITFETAKLAQEKGYPIFNNYSKSNFYNRKTKSLIYFGRTGRQTQIHLYPAPTQSLLQKWLREVHNVHIDIYFQQNINKYGSSIDYNINSKWEIIGLEDTFEQFDTYELALEFTLQEALKLI